MYVVNDDPRSYEAFPCFEQVWYSPQAFGKVWARHHPVTANTMTEKDHATGLLITAAADAGFAFLLNYLSRYDKFCVMGACLILCISADTFVL